MCNKRMVLLFFLIVLVCGCSNDKYKNNNVSTNSNIVNNNLQEKNQDINNIRNYNIQSQNESVETQKIDENSNIDVIINEDNDKEKNISISQVKEETIIYDKSSSSELVKTDLIISEINESSKSSESSDGSFIIKNRDIYNKAMVQMSEENWEKLINNEFVLDYDDNQFNEFFEIYKKNKNDNFPSFITIDSLIHTYNRYLWNLKTKIDEKVLYDLLLQISEESLIKAKEYYEKLKDTDYGIIAKALRVYFSVPLKIANKDLIVDEDIAYIVDDEILAINNISKEKKVRPIFEEFAKAYYDNIEISEDIDSNNLVEIAKKKNEKTKQYHDNYEEYRIASLFEEDSVLNNYYKILLWYRQIAFKINDEYLNKMALLLSYSLKDTNLIEEYNKADYVINYFLSSRHFGPNEYIDVIREIYGDGLLDVDVLLDESKYNQFTNRLNEKSSDYSDSIQRIQVNTSLKNDIDFRFIGKSHTYDDDIIDNMVYGSEGNYTNFIDVRVIPSSFGSTIMKDILVEHYKYWYEFKDRLEKLESIVPQFVEDYNDKTIFSKFMKALKRLVVDEDKNYSSSLIKNNEDWSIKLVNSFCGGFIELKYDIKNIFRNPVVQQSKEDLLKNNVNDSTIKYDDKGYVEPEINLYNELINFNNDIIGDLDGIGVLNDSDIYKINSLTNLLSQLVTISDKELNGEELDETEYDLISNYGDIIEEYIVNEDDYFFDVYCGSKYGTALSVDVMSGTDLNLNEKTFKYSIGNPVNVYVLVNVAGKYKICRGATYKLN